MNLPLHQTHPLERLSGAVERVTFHSEESGFCMLRIKVRGQRDLAAVTGSAASVTPGESIEAFGNWVNDRTHGLQFKASQLKVVPPSTLEGIEKYIEASLQPVYVDLDGVVRRFFRLYGKALSDMVLADDATRVQQQRLQYAVFP